MRFINLTNHEITIHTDWGIVVIPPSGNIARIVFEQKDTLVINGINVSVEEPIGCVSLPDPQEGVYYIVSTIVALAFPERDDLLVPDTTNGAIYDNNNRFIGVSRLRRITKSNTAVHSHTV